MAGNNSDCLKGIPVLSLPMGEQLPRVASFFLINGLAELMAAFISMMVGEEFGVVMKDEELVGSPLNSLLPLVPPR